MNDLVRLAIEAHGGLDRWNQIREISARIVLWGPGLKQRGPLGEALSRMPMRLRVATQVQKVTLEPFTAPGQKGVYDPSRAVIESPGETPSLVGRTGNKRMVYDIDLRPARLRVVG